MCIVFNSHGLRKLFPYKFIVMTSILTVVIIYILYYNTRRTDYTTIVRVCY